ncbi:MAG: aldo/keto reductase [Candidatus Neomarinimicrobiota bacterium]
MELRQLGRTELQLSTIGFGAWALGGGDYAFGWGPQDDDESVSAIHRALDRGVNWIDTAAIYGLGRSEEVVGKALKGIRQEVIVATKCSLIWDDRGNISNSLHRDSILREVEDSLRRLQTDYIDIYQIHWPSPPENISDGWETLMGLVEAGKVRYPAVSNFSVEQLEQVSAIHPVASLQPPYSMFKRDVEADILPYCRDQKIGVVAYSPMQNGLLTGKFTKDRAASLPDDDFRRRSPDFTMPRLEINLVAVEKLKKIAVETGGTPAQLALAWVLRRPEVTSAISGTRKPAQIDETAKAADWRLDESVVDAIASILTERDKQIAQQAS